MSIRTIVAVVGVVVAALGAAFGGVRAAASSAKAEERQDLRLDGHDVQIRELNDELKLKANTIDRVDGNTAALCQMLETMTGRPSGCVLKPPRPESR